MAIRNILVPVFHGVDFLPQLDAALRLGRREPVHIGAVFVRPDAAVLAASMPDMLIAAGITVEHIEGEGCAAEASAKAEFEAWCLANNVTLGGSDLTVCTASWRERTGSVEAVVLEAGRVSDLIIIRRPGDDDGMTQRAFDAAVFATGRPTLIVPDELPEDLTDHILIAWNSSIEVTRAVAGAMPLLRQANHVSIFTAPSHTDEALRDIYLGEQRAWHGIHARNLQPPTDMVSVGISLLAAAEREHASLILMGAYTHSRVREMLLGGVTRHVLREAKIPILMMH